MLQCWETSLLAVTRKGKLLVDGVSDFPNSHSAIKAREGDVCFGSGTGRSKSFHHVGESSLTSQGSGPRWNWCLSVMWKPRKVMQRDYRVRKSKIPPPTAIGSPHG